MIDFFSDLTERVQNGMFIAAVISVVLIALFFLLMYISQLVLDYRKFRRHGSSVLRSVVCVLKYTYVLRFETVECPTGEIFAVTKLLKSGRERITLPDGVQAAGARAFAKTSLNEITLPDTLQYIGECAFEKCPITEIVIPQGVVHIGRNAFRGCDKLERAEMPFSAHIDHSLFRGCTKLKTLIVSGHEYDLPNGGDGVGTPVFWAFTAVTLACEGCGEALRHTEENCGTLLELFAGKKLVEKLEQLFSLPFDIPAEQIDRAIEKAVLEGASEVYVMLLHYKRDRFGFDDSEDITERFEL